ncbi:hypothetical protein LCGC14_0145900 [marine sediment metagenome]|uniref:Uncharacterized protein n=1 Tax=marine sediment metagenome TaxID=412755 RepID=A0A0F9V3C6_9ZZZZ
MKHQVKLTHFEKMSRSTTAKASMKLMDRAAKECGKKFPTFTDVLNTKAVGELTGRMFNLYGLSEEDEVSYDAASIVASLHIMYQMWGLQKAGKGIFHILPEMADRLLYTKLNKVPTESIKTPFEFFYISAPPIMQIWNQLSGEHNLTGIYVCLPPDQPKEDRRMYICGVGEEKSARKIVELAGGTIRDEVIDDAVTWFYIVLNKPTADECLKAFLAKYKNEANNIMGPNYERTKEMFRFVLNTCLYLTSKTPDMMKVFNDEVEIRKKLKRAKSSGKRKKLERKLHNVRPSYIIVGPKTEEEVNKPSEKTGIKITVQTRVRGHGRWQACGIRWSQHKLIWIEPHTRGRYLRESKKQYVIKVKPTEEEVSRE